MILLCSYRSTLASCDSWLHVSCHVLEIFGRATDFQNERDWMQTSSMSFYQYTILTIFTGMGWMPNTIRMITTRTYVRTSKNYVRPIMPNIWRCCVENVHAIRLLCMMRRSGKKSRIVCDAVSHHVTYQVLPTGTFCRKKTVSVTSLVVSC